MAAPVLNSVDAVHDAASSPAALRRFLHGLPGVDQVGCEARTATLSTRSIKTTAKAWALDLAISMIDLTTLEGQDTVGKVRALCAKAMRPDPADATCPRVAAICVYPDMVTTAKEALGSSGVHVASVATAFPSGRSTLAIKLQDTRDAVAAGADEIDMVIDRGAFLSGDYQQVFDEIVAVKEACAARQGRQRPPQGDHGDRRAGDLRQRAPRVLVVDAGRCRLHQDQHRQDPAGCHMPVTLIMLEAVRDFREATGRQVGVKPAGGISTAKDAIKYLVMVNETAGDDWLDPDWFRFGASRLLNDLLMQRTRLATGRYCGPDYFTLD